MIYGTHTVIGTHSENGPIHTPLLSLSTSQAQGVILFRPRVLALKSFAVAWSSLTHLPDHRALDIGSEAFFFLAAQTTGGCEQLALSLNRARGPPSPW